MNDNPGMEMMYDSNLDSQYDMGPSDHGYNAFPQSISPEKAPHAQGTRPMLAGKPRGRNGFYSQKAQQAYKKPMAQKAPHTTNVWHKEPHRMPVQIKTPSGRYQNSLTMPTQHGSARKPSQLPHLNRWPNQEDTLHNQRMNAPAYIQNQNQWEKSTATTRPPFYKPKGKGWGKRHLPLTQ